VRSALTVGTFTPSFLIEVARRDGRFAEAGLDVSEVAVTSSPQQFRSLAQGDYDLVFTNPDNVIAYQFLTDNPLQERLALRVFAGIDRGLGLGLYRGPQVGPDVFAGRLGVDVATSGFAFVAYEILTRRGVEVSDIAIETLGATPRRVRALVEGECDYTILNAGNELRALALGCSLVAQVQEVGPYLGTVLAAMCTEDTERIATQNRFRDVMADTVASVASGSRDDDVAEVVGVLLGLDEAAARQHVRCITNPSTGVVPGVKVDRASIATVVSLRARHRATRELDRVLTSLDTFIDDDVLVE
jgi:ABC-type nitrate/sulfonate/bicarbonate transport system substrate-binding protein